LFLLVAANAVLYALFTAADASGSHSLILGAAGGAAGTGAGGLPADWLKYASICLCFVISVVVLRGASYRRDARLQVVILAFTLAADFMILFTPYYAAGVAVFCGAQFTAVLRYGGGSHARTMAAVAGLTAAGIASVGLIPETGDMAGTDLLLAAAAAYTVLITAATVHAFKRRQARVNNVMSRVGMVLFMLCDVNVLLWNVRSAAGTVTAESAAAIPEWTFNLIWTFYLPAQTMLALSARDFEDKGTGGDHS
jgi:hypothetical protein